MVKLEGKYNFKKVNIVHNALIRIYGAVKDHIGEACICYANRIDKAAFEYRSQGKRPEYYKDGKDVLAYAEFLDDSLADWKLDSIRHVNALTDDQLLDLSRQILPFLADTDKFMGIVTCAVESEELK